ncbi:uncharacterized protein LOC115522287 [Lynx canadensis]|uniref:uncharacterized protein LOC115522287 n=1 Tax=Lynx canadensis TaxID=61383 RepID=UPI0011B05D47|nr:uncharacterized protein LOC115522287 [Lynx canadensis]
MPTRRASFGKCPDLPKQRLGSNEAGEASLAHSKCSRTTEPLWEARHRGTAIIFIATLRLGGSLPESLCPAPGQLSLPQPPGTSELLSPPHAPLLSHLAKRGLAFEVTEAALCQDLHFTQNDRSLVPELERWSLRLKEADAEWAWFSLAGCVCLSCSSVGPHTIGPAKAATCMKLKQVLNHRVRSVTRRAAAMRSHQAATCGNVAAGPSPNVPVPAEPTCQQPLTSMAQHRAGARTFKGYVRCRLVSQIRFRMVSQDAGSAALELCDSRQAPSPL